MLFIGSFLFVSVWYIYYLGSLRFGLVFSKFMFGSVRFAFLNSVSGSVGPHGFNYNKRLILLFEIHLSGGHCIKFKGKGFSSFSHDLLLFSEKFAYFLKILISDSQLTMLSFYYNQWSVLVNKLVHTAPVIKTKL